MTPADPPAPGTAAQRLIAAGELKDLYLQQSRQLLEMQQLYAEMQARDQTRAVLLARLLSVEEQERGRISRDIHDGPLQDLAVLLLMIERCRRQIDAGAIGEGPSVLTEMREEVQQIIGALRLLIADLRPSALDTHGLLSALDFLAGRLRRDTTITVEISSQLGSRLDPSLEVVVFRLVQEALTNIRQHARAQHAWVRLARVGDDLRLEVRDDGCGFAARGSIDQALATGHIGLASMRERAELVGGHLEIESSAEQGTVLRVVVPFQPAAAAPPPRLRRSRRPRSAP